MSVNLTVFRILLAMGVALLACVDASCRLSPSTTQAAIDRSTPQGGYEFFIGAVERKNVAEVSDSVLLQLELPDAQKRLLIERLILGCNLYWKIKSNFGRAAAFDAMSYGQIPFVPRSAAADLKFEAPTTNAYPPRSDITASTFGGNENEPHFKMACVKGAWRLDRRLNGDGVNFFIVEDATWRNAMLRRALAQLDAGNISDVNQLHAALVPAPSTTQAATKLTDRATPADVPWAIRIAVDAGNIQEAADCYVQSGVRVSNELKAIAENYVIARELDRALHAKFGKAQGGRLVKVCNLGTEEITERYSNVTWTIDGDVARGLRDGERYDPYLRMLRNSGKWRIELPASDQVLSPAEQEQVRKQDADDLKRRQVKTDLLAHLDRYRDPGSVLDALSPALPSAMPVDPNQRKRDLEARHAEIVEGLAKQEREFAATQAKMSPQERGQSEICLSLTRQLFLGTGCDNKPVEEIRIVDGDADGAYLKARDRRWNASQRMTTAADREIDDGADHLIYEFKLTDSADDWMAILEINWTVKCDRATGTPPEGVGKEPFWTPMLRRVGSDWKVDVTDETDGNPVAAAARADSETKSIDQITAEINALKFQTLDDLRAAIRAANIKGTDKPM